jgi:hypothetical protein
LTVLVISSIEEAVSSSALACSFGALRQVGAALGDLGLFGCCRFAGFKPFPYPALEKAHQFVAVRWA